MLNTIVFSAVGVIGAEVLTLQVLTYLAAKSGGFDGEEGWWLVFNFPFYAMASWVLAYYTERIHWALRALLVSVGSLLLGWGATTAIAYATGHPVFAGP